MPKRTRESERAQRRWARWMARLGTRWWLPIPLLVAATGCRAPETPQRIYELHCLGCHGAKGEGPWGPNIQDLNRTVDQIVAVIAEGRGKMPAFGGHLSNADMRGVAEYVKTFRSKP